MKQTVAWTILVTFQLASVACSNEAAPGTQFGAMGATAGTGLGAAGGGITPVAMTAAGAPASPSTPVATAGTGSAGNPAAASAGTAPSSASAAGSGTAGTAASSMLGAAGSAMGAAGSTMAAAGSAAQAGTGSEMPASGFKPKCLAKGAELALIGDSWINYPLGEFLEPRLTQRAQRDGALKAGDRYSDQAVAGTSLASGGLGLILDQWPAAKAAAQAAGTSVRFVIMDGGGNDVLLGNQSCLENGKMRDQDPSCQRTVMAATMAGRMLQQKMRMDGVGQAIYFFYPHVPAGGWDVLDYSLPMAKATCESMNDDKYQCYFIDTREAFQGAGNTGVAKASYIGVDGIHPTAAGDDVLADLIWKTMKEHCMAQPVESGCCTP
ncbi:MAG TPA: SGNH/GDSL hydrolase family protein [Polyangiales bacterium]|nr:SGNH/GDSL hydrolase family protein [Polyangiales bacterium]